MVVGVAVVVVVAFVGDKPIMRPIVNATSKTMIIEIIIIKILFLKKNLNYNKTVWKKLI